MAGIKRSKLPDQVLLQQCFLHFKLRPEKMKSPIFGGRPTVYSYVPIITLLLLVPWEFCLANKLRKLSEPQIAAAVARVLTIFPEQLILALSLLLPSTNIVL